jgi:hypothetical protein
MRKFRGLSMDQSTSRKRKGLVTKHHVRIKAPKEIASALLPWRFDGANAALALAR